LKKKKVQFLGGEGQTGQRKNLGVEKSVADEWGCLREVKKVGVKGSAEEGKNDHGRRKKSKTGKQSFQGGEKSQPTTEKVVGMTALEKNNGKEGKSRRGGTNSKSFEVK